MNTYVVTLTVEVPTDESGLSAAIARGEVMAEAIAEALGDVAAFTVAEVFKPNGS